jgi:hypothetical protein
MKRILTILATSLFIVTACHKKGNDALEGSWKLTEVYDKNTGTTTYPPLNTTEDVVITFTGDNNFHGHTLVNIFSAGTYTIPSETKIVFENYISTLVAEDEWGSSFMTVLNACMLQSVSPCLPSVYDIDGNTLKIFSPLRYDMVLKKQ